MEEAKENIVLGIIVIIITIIGFYGFYYGYLTQEITLEDGTKVWASRAGNTISFFVFLFLIVLGMIGTTLLFRGIYLKFKKKTQGDSMR